MSKLKDLTGMKFNRLTVIKRGEDRISPCGQKQTRWYCKCNCGNPILVLIATCDLTKEHTQSCGCLQRERAIEGNKKYNIYNLTGEYGIGYTLKGEPFFFDLEDYDKIKDYCWHINDNGYIVNKTRKKSTRMHRLVLGLNEKGRDNEGDHIHHVRHDNRKNQLRITTTSQNQMNKLLTKHSTSKVKGISFNEKGTSWHAYITKDNKRTSKYFKNKEDAIEWRAKKELELFKEYAYTGEGTAQCQI